MLFEHYEMERRSGAPGQDIEGSSKAVIYTLKIECVDGLYLEQPCERVIEMRSNQTLDHLHHAIQKAVDFDNDHLFEFFIGRHYSDRKIIFSELDDEAEPDDVELSRIWPLPKGMHLFYWFDFGDDWKFRIKLKKGTKDPVQGTNNPRLISQVGPNPRQYPDCE